MRVYVTLSRADGRLAQAYAKDRGIPLGTLAGASLMADVRKTVNRSHLRDAVTAELEERMCAMVAQALVDAGIGVGDLAVAIERLQGPRARAQGVIEA